MKLSEKELKTYRNVCKHTKINELIVMGWWSFFNKKKMEKLHKCIMNGMHWDASYMLAKNLQ